MPSKSKRQPAERERALKALALRREGLPYRVIAERLEWGDESSARYAVARLLDRTEAEEVAEMRYIEGERLDELQRTHWAAALAGDLDAGKMVLKVMERRARLFGLDAPSKVAVEQMTSVEFAEQFIELVGRMDSRMLAEAIAQLPGGSAVAVDLMRDVMLAKADEQVPNGRSVVEGTVGLGEGGSVDARWPTGHPADEDDEPWSNL
ncbi:hypothetical protein [Mycolicibacillus trivialis]|uniref:Uncharacterized protein n=1 Tax=Mycolicibacillus trivialis TaxID=1798 RepID=A0A1X2EGM4_9MYCO|nr:hypothetical protein [Mycolicibacillus trivialis]ORX01317.1 hypothetical protein AWC30_13975 [Mycolicibacillus trivialis]